MITDKKDEVPEGAIPIAVSTGGVINPSIDEVAEKAREVLLKDGFHSLVLIACGDKGHALFQINQVPKTHELRSEMLNKLGEMLAAKKLVGILEKFFMINEAWMAVVDKKDLDANGSVKVMPRDNPDRMEVLIVTGHELGNKASQIRAYKMLRDKKGKLTDAVLDGQTSSDNDLNAESPLLNSFIAGFAKGFHTA